MYEDFHQSEEKEILSKNDDADEVIGDVVAELVNFVCMLKGGDARYTSTGALRGQPFRSRLYILATWWMRKTYQLRANKKRRTIQNWTG